MLFKLEAIISANSPHKVNWSLLNLLTKIHRNWSQKLRYKIRMLCVSQANEILTNKTYSRSSRTKLISLVNLSFCFFSLEFYSFQLRDQWYLREDKKTKCLQMSNQLTAQMKENEEERDTKLRSSHPLEQLGYQQKGWKRNGSKEWG